MRPFLSFILFCVLTPTLLAQNEADYWFFGEKNGLHFTATGVELFANSQVKYNEGLSSMTDCKGELLFYCDAETVWNKQHQAMTNGTDLLGSYSATQGSLIVQHPGDCDLFFVFTQDAKEHGYANGLRYNIVDMRLQNGLGEVTLKNQLLHIPSTEKLAAVRHSDGQSVWVISHEMNSNVFRSYLLTSAGLDTVPVLSSVGAIYAALDGMGQMKASPDGRRIGVAHLNPQEAEVFDFDPTTGKLSNPILLPETSFAKDGLYGLEFSPDGNLLYLANHTVNYLDEVGFLYQINLLAGSEADIINSAKVVGQNVPATDLRGLQLGPDGKLYVARSLGKYLGVVNQPNKPGLGCDYVDEGLYLGGKTATWSLPNFLASYFKEGAKTGKPTAEFEVTPDCLEDGVMFHAANAGDGVVYDWDFGDGTTATVQSLRHIYPDTGTYPVRLVVNKNCCKDTATASVSVKFCENNAYYLPTAFSPNDDGINDTLQVFGQHISSLHLAVYDRWGERVFESNDPSLGWDGWFRGKKMDLGVYAFTLAITFRNGESRHETGSFLLVK